MFRHQGWNVKSIHSSLNHSENVLIFNVLRVTEDSRAALNTSMWQLFFSTWLPFSQLTAIWMESNVNWLWSVSVRALLIISLWNILRTSAQGKRCILHSTYVFIRLTMWFSRGLSVSAWTTSIGVKLTCLLQSWLRYRSLHPDFSRMWSRY